MKRYLTTSVVTIMFIASVLNLAAQNKESNEISTKTSDPTVLTNAPRIIPVIRGSGRQNNLDFIECTGSKFFYPTVGVVLRFSFGRSEAGVIGSWTVRSVESDAGRTSPETVASYIFDGVFTSGHFDPETSNPRTFDLSGTTTYAADCGAEDILDGGSRQYNVRIWGACGNNIINFEVRNQKTGAQYASATFSAETEVSCGFFGSDGVSGILNHHKQREGQQMGSSRPLPSLIYDTVPAPSAIYEFSFYSSRDGVQAHDEVQVEDALLAGGERVLVGAVPEGDGKNQQWILIPAGRVGTRQAYYILNYGFLKYLTAMGNREGSPVTVQNPSNSDNQLWFVSPRPRTGNDDSTYRSWLIESVLYRGLFFRSPGNQVGEPCDNCEELRLSYYSSASFVTHIVGEFTPPTQGVSAFFNILPSYNDRKFFNLPASNTENGTPITIWDGNPGVPNLQWEFIRDGAGYYEIKPRPANGTKSISVAYASMNNGANITLYDCINADNQKWLIVPVVREPGKYIFFNKLTGKCINVAGGNISENNTPVQQYVYLNQDNCKWFIRPAQ